MRILLYLGLPVGFVSHLPVMLVRDPDPYKLALLGSFAILLSTLAWMSFQTGLECYESGNRMGARI